MHVRVCCVGACNWVQCMFFPHHHRYIPRGVNIAGPGVGWYGAVPQPVPSAEPLRPPLPMELDAECARRQPHTEVQPFGSDTKDLRLSRATPHQPAAASLSGLLQSTEAFLSLLLQQMHSAMFLTVPADTELICHLNPLQNASVKMLQTASVGLDF